MSYEKPKANRVNPLIMAAFEIAFSTLVDKKHPITEKLFYKVMLHEIQQEKNSLY